MLVKGAPAVTVMITKLDVVLKGKVGWEYQPASVYKIACNSILLLFNEFASDNQKYFGTYW